ncbi:hypothetical protein RCG24_04720 [Neobacillus sp. OS1-32]|uniref:hypothetical protein n=1 Tax=Neobacillus sp. OS1-32 TaxID=3070682 RepID=UPI0027E168B8|nr:hypothetical protein [Neobacillus sp. OS1-32]WML31188.1 hypothetical protein RCG24_04720 [Neobacillus sp. OS1-32]
MKKWSVFVLFIVLLTGCRSTPFSPEISIDWVDFVKWDGKSYDGIYTGVLADKKFIGEKLGEVKFKVADNVTNPNYKIRNGDAAFHEKGTEIFTIKGYPQLIAVKSSRDIHGYRVYFSRDDSEYKWHFMDMPTEKVQRIEIYLAYTPNGSKKIVEINNTKEVKRFLQILNNGESSPNFQPNTEHGNPTYYEMVFYTDKPVAYKFDLQFDGNTYYWHPADTAILSKEISDFLPKNDGTYRP